MVAKVYFPNLNALRFLAAMMVFAPHVEQFKQLYNLHYSFQYIPPHLGKLGVVLFFVLSGFLITYLLLAEEQKKGKIFTGRFYRRRILRIWPLYYFLLFLGLVVVPAIPGLAYDGYTLENMSLSNVMLYIFMLPNIALVVPFIGHTWTIGVEEQMYIIWPLLLKKIRNRYLLLGLLIVSYLLLYFVVVFRSHIGLMLHPMVVEFIEWFKIDVMALGGLSALLYFHESKWLTFLYNRTLQIGLYAMLLVLLISKVVIPILHFEVFGGIFALIILNLATNKDSIFSIEHPLLNYFGKISYGIYMYHPLVIGLVLTSLLALEVFSSYLLYPLSAVLTLLVAHLSYNWLELPFLRKKETKIR